MRRAKSNLREYCAGYWPGEGAVCSLGGVLACAICFQVLILKADQIQETHLYAEIFKIVKPTVKCFHLISNFKWFYIFIYLCFCFCFCFVFS